MSKHSRSKTVWRVILAIVSVLVIVALATVAVIYRPTWIHADSPVTQRSSVSRTVSPRQLETYCPARMTIADTDAYGDSEYQASNGNIMSSARYASFGSVFRSSVGLLGADEATSSLVLNKDDAGSDDDIFMASGTVDDGAQLQNTRLLSASDGTGAASSVMSWATEGDLKGVSAASCVAPSLKQSLMVSGTKTGMTQQLVVANSSSKATVVDVRVWGTEQSGALALSTGSTLTVAANAESVLSLSAAASGQKGLYVTVSSRQTPVSASVRVIRTEGLNPKGSDYAAAAGEASKELVFPAVAEGDKATLTVYAAGSGSLTAAWVGSAGQSVHQYSGDRVTTIDLGDVPKDASALKITADTKVTAGVTVSRDGNGNQSDFALIGAAQTDDRSAAVIPSGLDGRVSVVNASLSSKQMHMTGYDDKGAAVGEKTITVDAGAAASFDASDLGKNVFAVAADGKGLAWGVRLSSSAVSDAKLAGIAYIGATPLMPLQERIWARSDMTIVH